MVIKRLAVEGFRAIGNRVEFRPAMINLIVGRNNTGKSSILEALASFLSALNGYVDALGRDVFKEVFLFEKRISPEFLVHELQERFVIEADISTNEGFRRKLSLELMVFDENIPETLHRLLIKNFIERTMDFVRKKITMIKRTSFRDLLYSTVLSSIWKRRRIYFREEDAVGDFSSIIREIYENIRGVRMKVQDTELIDRQELLMRLDNISEKVKILMSAAEKDVDMIIEKIMSGLQKAIKEELLRKMLSSKKVFLVLRDRDEYLDVRFMFTRPVEVKVSVKKYEEILSEGFSGGEHL